MQIYEKNTPGGQYARMRWRKNHLSYAHSQWNTQGHRFWKHLGPGQSSLAPVAGSSQPCDLGCQLQTLSNTHSPSLPVEHPTPSPLSTQLSPDGPLLSAQFTWHQILPNLSYTEGWVLFLSGTVQPDNTLAPFTSSFIPFKGRWGDWPHGWCGGTWTSILGAAAPLFPLGHESSSLTLHNLSWPSGPTERSVPASETCASFWGSFHSRTTNQPSSLAFTSNQVIFEPWLPILLSSLLICFHNLGRPCRCHYCGFTQDSSIIHICKCHMLMWDCVSSLCQDRVLGHVSKAFVTQVFTPLPNV